MRTLAINTFMTLDGVMQAPGGPDEDPTGGFTHGGWSVNYWDDGMGRRMDELMARPFDLLLGRKTYEIFAAHWPHMADDAARREAPDALVETATSAAAPLNDATKYVATKTLERADWAHTNLIRGDVPGEVAALKRQDGPEIQVHGSSNLIQTLLAHDLVDEFRLWIFPLVLGRGKRVFADGSLPGGLRLVDSFTSSTGVIVATYERAGDVEYGSFALDEPSQEELERRRNLE
jgi:dihydrofolate reductase